MLKKIAIALCITVSFTSAAEANNTHKYSHQTQFLCVQRAEGCANVKLAPKQVAGPVKGPVVVAVPETPTLLLLAAALLALPLTSTGRKK